MAKDRFANQNEAIRFIEKNYPKVSISGRVIKVNDEVVGLGFWGAADYLENCCKFIVQGNRLS